MHIETVADGNVTLARMAAGDLLLSARDVNLEGTVADLLERGETNVLIDLSEIRNIDALGLGALVQAFTLIRGRGGQLKLLHVPPRIRQVLEATRLVTVFELYEDRDEALASFPPQLPRPQRPPVQPSAAVESHPVAEAAPLKLSTGEPAQVLHTSERAPERSSRYLVWLAIASLAGAFAGWEGYAYVAGHHPYWLLPIPCIVAVMANLKADTIGLALLNLLAIGLVALILSLFDGLVDMIGPGTIPGIYVAVAASKIVFAFAAEGRLGTAKFA